MVTQLLATLVLFISVCAWLIVMTVIVERRLKKHEDRVDDVVFKSGFGGHELFHINKRDTDNLREMMFENQIRTNSKINYLEKKLDELNKREEQKG